VNLEELRREGQGEAFWRAIEISTSAHLSYEVLEAYADKLLDVTGQAAVHAHTEGCPRCQAALADFLGFAVDLGRAVPKTEPPAQERSRLLTPVNLLLAAIFVLVLAVIPFAFPSRGDRAAAPGNSPSALLPVLPASVHSLIPAYDEILPMVDFGSESLASPLMVFDQAGTAVAVIDQLTGSRSPIKVELARGETYSWKTANGRAGRFRVLSIDESKRWSEARQKAADTLALAEAAIGFGLLSEAETLLKPLAASDPLARQMLKEMAALRSGTPLGK
jgi:anti-sigma factor RsiW